MVKTFKFQIEVKAIINTNSNFHESAHAHCIINDLFQDATNNCLRMQRKAPNNKELQHYLEGKIKAYEAIQKTITYVNS